MFWNYEIPFSKISAYSAKVALSMEPLCPKKLKKLIMLWYLLVMHWVPRIVCRMQSDTFSSTLPFSHEHPQYYHPQAGGSDPYWLAGVATTGWQCQYFKQQLKGHTNSEPIQCDISSKAVSKKVLYELILLCRDYY